MNAKAIIRLAVGGTGCESMQLISDGTTLSVAVDYLHETQRFTELIEFDDVIAFRFRDEMHSRGFHAESYDTVVEVMDSAWLAELLAIEPSHILGGAGGKRHFAVLLSNNGYLEIIAKDVRRSEPSRSLMPSHYA